MSRFHRQHGDGVELVRGSMTARARDTNPGVGMTGVGNMVHGAEPLKGNASFFFHIDDPGPFPVLSLGVTSHKPGRSGTPPEIAWQSEGCWVLDDWGGLNKNGSEIGKYPTNLKVAAGDSVGLMRTENGSLHIFHNGNDLGAAFHGLPDGPVWPLIGLGFVRQISIGGVSRSPSTISRSMSTISRSTSVNSDPPIPGSAPQTPFDAPATLGSAPPTSVSSPSTPGNAPQTPVDASPTVDMAPPLSVNISSTPVSVPPNPVSAPPTPVSAPPTPVSATPTPVSAPVIPPTLESNSTDNVDKTTLSLSAISTSSSPGYISKVDVTSSEPTSYGFSSISRISVTSSGLASPRDESSDGSIRTTDSATITSL